jgi:hypothetical protein
LREEPGNRLWHRDEVDTLGHLTWERIAGRFEAVGGPPVSPETLRTDWFGTRREIRRYGWEQLIYLATALDVSLFEIILPTEEEDMSLGRVSDMYEIPGRDPSSAPYGTGMAHASTVFKMPVDALRDQARRSWAREAYRDDILHHVLQQHPWIANLKDERDKAMADGIPIETAYEVWFNQVRQRTDVLRDSIRDRSSPTLDALANRKSIWEGRPDPFWADFNIRDDISREDTFTVLGELGILEKGAN